MSIYINGEPWPLAQIYKETLEIGRHIHNYSRWLGAAIVPNAEVHVADKLSLNPVAFSINAGNNAFGAWVQILGSADTPVIPGKTKFDLRAIQTTTNQRAGEYFIQLAFGVSGAAAFVAEEYTSDVIAFDGVNNEHWFEFQSKQITAGTKAWMRCLSPGNDGGTLSFFFGLHEYDA